MFGREKYLGRGVGMYAWALQRICAVGLTIYLFLHIYVISTAQYAGQGDFNDLMASMHTPLLLLIDLGLMAAVMIHALNGVRVIIMDMGYGVRQQKALLYAMAAVGAMVLAVSAYLVMPEILGGL